MDSKIGIVNSGMLSHESVAVNHFPPLSAAPILAYYDDESGSIEPGHTLEAPVDERGVVDIYATVEKALGCIDPEYIFPKEHCDVHHFVWERSNYLPSRHGGSVTPSQYREIPFHKGYLPRQLHNFMHTVIAPPPVPSMEVMARRVESYDVARRLFATARIALQFERISPKSLPLRKRWRREQLLDEDILCGILTKLEGRYVRELDLTPRDTDYVDIDSLRERPIEEAATHLGRVAARSSINMLPYIYANRIAA